MTSWKYILFDLECNGFKPTKIFMISMVDLISHQRQNFIGVDEVTQAILRLSEASLLVGHNIKTFDCRIIEKLTDNAVTFDRSRILDTLYLSKAMVKMTGHKLEDWGEILDIPKMKAPVFHKFTPEMIPYCERDVELNLQVFLALVGIMEQRHGEKIPLKWQMLTEYRKEFPRLIPNCLVN